MPFILALNLFMLVVIAVKVERTAFRQLEADYDDTNYNDWNFETEQQ